MASPLMPSPKGQGSFFHRCLSVLRTRGKKGYDLLSGVRPRDLFLIVAGGCGILFFGFLFLSRQLQFVSHQREISRQEEQRKLQEETRQQLARQGGVRAIPLSDAGDPRKPTSTGGLVLAALDVHSDPLGADVFLDWTWKGKTPLRLEGEGIAGLLVVVKEGRRAAFERAGYHSDATLHVTLPPESSSPASRLLFWIAGSSPEDTFTLLRQALLSSGFFVLGPEEAQEFQREETRVKTITHQGLRAWTKARFDTDFLVTARLSHHSRDVGKQGAGSPDVRGVMEGTIATEVSIDLDMTDLRSGALFLTAEGKGAAIALDEPRSMNKALSQAASQAAAQLSERFLAQHPPMGGQPKEGET